MLAILLKKAGVTNLSIRVFFNLVHKVYKSRIWVDGHVLQWLSVVSCSVHFLLYWQHLDVADIYSFLSKMIIFMEVNLVWNSRRSIMVLMASIQ